MTVFEARGWQKGNKHEACEQNTYYELLFNHYQLQESHRGVHTPAPVSEASLGPHYAGSHLTCLLLEVQTKEGMPGALSFSTYAPLLTVLISWMRLHLSPRWLALATPFLHGRRIQWGSFCFDSKCRYQNLHSGQPDNKAHAFFAL